MVQIGRRGTEQRLFDYFKKFSKSQNSNFKILVHHLLRLCLLCIVKKFNSIRTKLRDEIDFKFAPMAIPPMALLQQHDAQRDMLIEPAVQRHAAIEARGHSELGAFGNGCVQNRMHNQAIKTNRLVLLFLISVARQRENGHYSMSDILSVW